MKLVHKFAGLAGAALFLLTSTAHAEAPARIPIQGYLTTATGSPIDGAVEVTFTLYASPNGPDGALFSETRSVSAAEGRFALQLGDGGAPMDLGLFRDVDGLWLGISVDGDREMSPRIAMTSVPYAAHAHTASDALTLDGYSADEFARIDEIDVTGLRADLDALTSKVGDTSAIKAAFDALKQAFDEQREAFESLRDEVGVDAAATVAQLASEVATQKELVKGIDERVVGLGEFAQALAAQIEALGSGQGGSSDGLSAVVSALSDEFAALQGQTDARIFQMQNDIDLAAVDLSTATEMVQAQNSALEAITSTLEEYVSVAEQLATSVADVAAQAEAAAQLASAADFTAQAAEAKADSAVHQAGQALASAEALAASIEYVQSDLAAAINTVDNESKEAINQLISDYSAAIGSAVAGAQGAMAAVEAHIADTSFETQVNVKFAQILDALVLAEGTYDLAAEASATADTNAGLLLQKDAEIQALTQRIEALEAFAASMQH
jgi:hypothetical protein